ncbi:MAG: FGLLP motif-containing membrane protein [Acidimicrobiia bacterium]
MGATVAGNATDRASTSTTEPGNRSSRDGNGGSDGGGGDREEAQAAGPSDSGDSGGSGDGGFFAPLERSALVSSIPAPSGVSFDAKHLATNFSIALLFILLSWFPAEVINSVVRQHHHRFAGKGRFRRWLERTMERLHSLPAPLLVGGFTLVAALIYGLLDPHFGFNQTTVLMLSAIFFGLMLITFAHEYVRAWYAKRFMGVPAHFETFPLGLVLAVLLVFFSRLAHFQPGYVFGVVAGVAFRGDVDERQDGKSLAVASLATLVLAIVTWILWIPVRDAALLPHPGVFALFGDALFAFVWIFAIQTVVFSLVPMHLLDGERVIKWSRGGWLALYVSGMFVFVTTLVHPTSTQYGGSSDASFWSMLLLFLAFTVFAVGLWTFFWLEDRRKGRSAGDPGDASVHAEADAP